MKKHEGVLTYDGMRAVMRWSPTGVVIYKTEAGRWSVKKDSAVLVNEVNYQPRVWMRNDGSVWLVNQRGETVLNTYIVPGLKWNAGDTFTLKAQVVGSDATTIQAKVWKSGTAEPSNWQITSTDSTPELQKAGTMGVTVYRSTSATGTGTYTFNGFRAAEVN